MTLSLLAFALSLWLFVRARPSRMLRVAFALAALSFLLLTLLYLIADSLTGKGIDPSVLYHLRYGLGGAGFAEHLPLVATLFLATLGGVILFAWAAKRMRREHDGRPWPWAWLSMLAILGSIALSPATVDLLRFREQWAGSLIASSSAPSPANARSFRHHYRAPSLTPREGPPLNLLWIYAEGLERTYFDEEIFPGLMTKLRRLAGQGLDFTNIEQAPGTGWTIAGMVASQCGIPLFTPSHGNSMSGMDTFLAGAICLGDLLKKHDYRLGYLGGARIEFAGKGKFYRTHRFDTVSGRKELMGQLEDRSYHSDWGLYDDSLFSIGIERMKKLSTSSSPFALLLLTLDTHGATGHASKSCADLNYRDGKNAALNAVACSDHLLSGLIEKVRASEFGKRTLIVLTSDHLAMRNRASALLKRGERRNLFMVWAPTVTAGRQIGARGSALDVGATLLPLLGFEAKLGLGRNLLGEEASLLASVRDFEARLMGWRPFIAAFWNFPKLREKIVVNIPKRRVRFDDRDLALPLLVRFDADLTTRPYFAFGRSHGQKRLADHLAAFEAGTPFFWVDHCDKMRTQGYLKAPEEGGCVLLGRAKSSFQRLSPVDGVMTITAREIKYLLRGRH